MTAVHQFVPALIPRDATGTHTLLLRHAFRQAGWESEIFAEATHDELVGESHFYEHYPRLAKPGDVLVYQFATSSAVADFLLERREALVLDYHNITRPDLLAGWDPEPARRSAEASRQLSALAPRAALGLAVSAYNEADLVAAGCRRTAVVPVLVDLERLAAPPDPRVVDRLRASKADGGSDWLFVGRVVSSKAQHDVVKALWAYRRLYDPRARLHLVGATPSRRYLSALRDFVEDLGLAGAVRFAGEVTEPALAAYFATADVYVSASRHEGFGIPLLEAMRADVPVVALAAAAVPATVGGAGLLMEDAEPARMAAAVQRVVADQGLRAHLVAAGHRQVAAHGLEAAGRLAVDAIATVVAGGAVSCG